MEPEIFYRSHAQVLLAHLESLEQGPLAMAASAEVQAEGEKFIASFLDGSIEAPKGGGEVTRAAKRIGAFLVTSAAKAEELDVAARGDELPGYALLLQGISDILLDEFGPDVCPYRE